MKTTTIEKLVKFASQRPGVDSCNYSDYRSYRAECREITNDLHDFRDLLNLAFCRVEHLEEKATKYLKKSSGRLTMTENGEIEYITGQYFPTEFRPAACRVLASLIWDDYREEKNNIGEYIHTDGNKIRAAIRKKVSRRVAKYYFN